MLAAEYPDLYHVCVMGGKMHSRGMLGYLTFMRVRLLKETGSIYLHCDHSANAYLRMLMDGVFGSKTSAMKLFGNGKPTAAQKQSHGESLAQ